MSCEDDLQAFRERKQGERFVRHLRDVAEARISRADLRLEVDEAFERNGARRDAAEARPDDGTAARTPSATG